MASESFPDRGKGTRPGHRAGLFHEDEAALVASFRCIVDADVRRDALSIVRSLENEQAVEWSKALTLVAEAQGSRTGKAGDKATRDFASDLEPARVRDLYQSLVALVGWALG